MRQQRLPTQPIGTYNAKQKPLWTEDTLDRRLSMQARLKSGSYPDVPIRWCVEAHPKAEHLVHQRSLLYRESICTALMSGDF